jgi:hypothetical protein
MRAQSTSSASHVWTDRRRLKRHSNQTSLDSIEAPIEWFIADEQQQSLPRSADRFSPNIATDGVTVATRERASQRAMR